MSFSPFPCTAYQARLFATYLADLIKPVSIRNYVSAVWYFQKLRGYPDYSSDFLLKQLLNGIERCGASYDRLERYAFTPTDLLAMYKFLDMSNNEDMIFWLAVIICYRALLRKCHVTASPHILLNGDVHIRTTHLHIKIRSSKSDQFGRSPFNIFLQKIPGSPLCPASLLEKVLAASNKEEVLLRLPWGGGGKLSPMKYSYFNSRLKGLAKKLGLPVKLVSTHSLRHGGATLLKSLGVPVNSIMAKGNWKSQAVYSYLHQSEQEMLLLEDKPVSYLKSLT